MDEIKRLKFIGVIIFAIIFALSLYGLLKFRNSKNETNDTNPDILKRQLSFVGIIISAMFIVTLVINLL